MSSADEKPVSVETLQVTTIKDVCFVNDCGEDVVGVAVYHSSKHHDIIAVWLCELHAAIFNEPEAQKRLIPDATTDVFVQETSRTCRHADEGGVTCGAYATHAIIMGAQYAGGRKPELRILSMCERHAAGPAQRARARGPSYIGPNA